MHCHSLASHLCQALFGVCVHTALCLASASAGNNSAQSASASATTQAGSTTTCTPMGSGLCRYVDDSLGSDSNSGTSTAPFKTIQKAADVINPGDVVIVRDGTYTTGSGGVLVYQTRGGTTSAWVTFKAEHKWGAVLDGQNNSATE